MVHEIEEGRPNRSVDLDQEGPPGLRRIQRPPGEVVWSDQDGGIVDRNPGCVPGIERIPREPLGQPLAVSLLGDRQEDLVGF